MSGTESCWKKEGAEARRWPGDFHGRNPALVYFGKPAPDLAQQISTYWCASSRCETGRTFYEILPDAGMNLMLRFAPSGCRMALMGPRTEKATVELDLTIDIGRIPKETKARLTKELTVKASEVTGIPADKFIVLINELERDNIGVGGTLLSELLPPAER